MGWLSVVVNCLSIDSDHMEDTINELIDLDGIPHWVVDEVCSIQKRIDDLINDVTEANENKEG